MGGLILIAALAMLPATGTNDIGVIAAMILWGLALVALAVILRAATGRRTTPAS
ncbi:hypothetical protein [Streptomyces sp. NPDC089795]|uniref:hypothetical protein n=1 Tax=Streptomyces sp. NPDC089795 TaxID=3155297 RepID=UPI003431DE8C